jgi:hypothetical protein
VHDLRTTLFISYYSGLKKIPREMRIAMCDVARDDRYIDNMYKRCEEFRKYQQGLQDFAPVRVERPLPQLF